MSAALQILDNATDALALGHDDALVLTVQGGQPVNVTGYAEEMDADPEERGARKHPQLHVGADVFTHCFHIRRDQLATVQLGKVSAITHSDSGRSYRVMHRQDAPMNRTVEFYCRLA
jgi:hypothetical protein